MKFLADCTLGKLTLWLRILGYDTVYSRSPIDRALLNQGLKEERIVLTRRRDTAERNYSGMVMILWADRVWDQIEELKKNIILEPSSEILFSRCVNCNSELHEVSRADIEGRVPSYIFQTHAQFHTCQHCGRIFWPGTHRERMLTAMAEHNLIHRP
jgi:uncharacterized protein with PIN domain